MINHEMAVAQNAMEIHNDLSLLFIKYIISSIQMLFPLHTAASELSRKINPIDCENWQQILCQMAIWRLKDWTGIDPPFIVKRVEKWNLLKTIGSGD